jgi:hypothetical protein
MRAHDLAGVSCTSLDIKKRATIRVEFAAGSYNDFLFLDQSPSCNNNHSTCTSC